MRKLGDVVVLDGKPVVLGTKKMLTAYRTLSDPKLTTQQGAVLKGFVDVWYKNGTDGISVADVAKHTQIHHATVCRHRDVLIGFGLIGQLGRRLSNNFPTDKALQLFDAPPRPENPPIPVASPFEGLMP